LVWGSEHGLLKFERLAFLADHLQDDWLVGLSD
jgi:CpeT protein